MKNKILAIIICVINLSFTMEANALFSITHFNLGTKMIGSLEQSGETLSESEKAAFLSGLVYADIGRFKFDKKTGIDSDSDKFADTMSQYAKTSEEQWFVRGFKAHIMQDKEAGEFLSKIFGRKGTSYKEYVMRCALLDSYFLKKSNLSIFNDALKIFNFDKFVFETNAKETCKMLGIPSDEVSNFINLAFQKYSNLENKYFLPLYDNLIKVTYKSLGVKIELSEIQNQASNILVASAVLAVTAGDKTNLDENLSISIEKEAQHLCDRCASYLCE